MSRNKMRNGNAYPAGYGLAVDGGGKMKPETVTVKDKDDGGIDARKSLAESKGEKKPEEKKEAPKSSIESGDSGITKIGKAGADMIGEYKRRKAEEA